MNQMMIAGHLGADPEVRFTSSGQKVTTLRVGARARRGSSKADETIWWKVTVWGEQFDKMISYLKKGSSIIVFGELSKPEIFTDREGKPQVSMNITATSLQFSPFGRGEGSGSHGGEAPAHPSKEPEMAHAMTQDTLQGQMDVTFSDDELPF